MVENPRTSDIWRNGPFQDLIMNHEMLFAQVDFCACGIKSHDGQDPLKTSVSLLTNSEAFAMNIGKTIYW